MDHPVGDLQPIASRETENSAGERGWSGRRCCAKQANVAFSEGNSLIYWILGSQPLLNLIQLSTYSRAVEKVITDHLSPLVE